MNTSPSSDPNGAEAPLGPGVFPAALPPEREPSPPSSAGPFVDGPSGNAVFALWPETRSWPDTVDNSFLFRRTVRSDLDDTMPVRTRDALYDTPFRLTTPMTLRAGVLRALHFSLEEIAELLFVNQKTAKKYCTRFFSEMTMTPEMSLRTTLGWSDFLLDGWDEVRERFHDRPFGGAA